MSPSFAEKAVSSKVLSRFGIGFACAFALLVAFAFLAFDLAQHREIHGYQNTSGCIRLCSAIVKQHRPDLRVALQDVRVQVAVVLHLRRCQRKYDTYVDVLVTFSSLTASVVCRIDMARFGCKKYYIRTRWRPLLLLSYVAFTPRHASCPLLTSVFFTVTRYILCTAVPWQDTAEDCAPRNSVAPLLRL